MTKNLVLIMVLCLLFKVDLAYASIWYVHPDSALNSIQAGLDSCSVGDTVLVAASTYYENIVWPSTQGIHLRSESGSTTTIIDGGGTDRVLLIDTGVDTTTIVDDFTIQNGSSNLGAGIYCSLSSSPVIMNNTIIANVSSNYAGGIACFESSPVIRDNLITSNTATSGGGGISCWDAGPVIYGNTITNNTANWGGGIDCTGTPSPHISKNTVVGNTANTGAGLYSGWGGSAPFIDSCTISNNIGDGVYCDASDAVLHYR